MHALKPVRHLLLLLIASEIAWLAWEHPPALTWQHHVQQPWPKLIAFSAQLFPGWYWMGDCQGDEVPRQRALNTSICWGGPYARLADMNRATPRAALMYGRWPFYYEGTG